MSSGSALHDRPAAGSFQHDQVHPAADGTDGLLAALASPGPADVLRRIWRQRAVRFGVVAASCTLIQLLVLAALTRLGVGKLAANGIGFVLSAQANFVLSAHVTWGDRKPLLARSAQIGWRARLGGWRGRWARFSTVALVALAVNELVFTIGAHAGARLLVASAAGILAGAALTFTAQPLRHLPRRERAGERRRPGRTASRSGADQRARRSRTGVAFFLPAFNEAANLRAIVPGAVDYFRRLPARSRSHRG